MICSMQPSSSVYRLFARFVHHDDHPARPICLPNFSGACFRLSYHLYYSEVSVTVSCFCTLSIRNNFLQLPRSAFFPSLVKVLFITIFVDDKGTRYRRGQGLYQDIHCCQYTRFRRIGYEERDTHQRGNGDTYFQH